MMEISNHLQYSSITLWNRANKWLLDKKLTTDYVISFSLLTKYERLHLIQPASFHSEYPAAVHRDDGISICGQFFPLYSYKSLPLDTSENKSGKSYTAHQSWHVRQQYEYYLMDRCLRRCHTQCIDHRPESLWNYAGDWPWKLRDAVAAYSLLFPGKWSVRQAPEYGLFDVPVHSAFLLQYWDNYWGKDIFQTFRHITRMATVGCHQKDIRIMGKRHFFNRLAHDIRHIPIIYRKHKSDIIFFHHHVFYLS